MLGYFQRLIDRDSPERVSAFLALLAGLTLCIATLALIFSSSLGLTFTTPVTVLITSFVTALTSLAVFNRVDKENTTNKEKS